MNLYLLAMDKIKSRPIWKPNDIEIIWSGSNDTEHAIIKRTGGYLTLIMLVQGVETKAGFTIGLTDFHGRPEPFLLATPQSYAAWVKEAQAEIVKLRQWARRQPQAEALWVS